MDKIPSHVHVGKRSTYEVVFIKEFSNKDLVGQMRPDYNQIVIKSGLSEQETVKTFIHELIHAIDEEHKIKLTETQTLKLEEGIYTVLRANKWL